MYCAGCIAVENYVLHLTQFFRLNGVDAVSELTQENAIISQGRGVFLNKMLSEAKFVLVLCTDGECDLVSPIHFVLAFVGTVTWQSMTVSVLRLIVGSICECNYR